MNRAQLLTGATLALLVGATAVSDGLRAAVRPTVPSVTTASAATTSVATPQWGTAATPFAADSPWNSRPLDAQLAPLQIRATGRAPLIEAGAWSTGVFVAARDDAPMTVGGTGNAPGPWNPDSEAFGEVRVPRWPATVTPATQSDGHAEIIDPVDGVVHSFWQLRRQGGRWVATQYAWSALPGRGWGDGAHYFQGARAAGVPALGGLIRKEEAADGQPYYRHALAMSLERSALSPAPAYVFPATSADTGARHINSGTVPQGALLMLPPGFDLHSIAHPQLRKIASTLMRYGAYVVDRNDGTPFVIYAQIGSQLDLHSSGWDAQAAAALDRIRSQLCLVSGARAWIDGNEQPLNRSAALNLLSMRGPWRGAGSYDSTQQRLVFGGPGQAEKDLPEGVTKVSWAQPAAGLRYRLRSHATGGASIRLRAADPASRRIVLDSGELGDGAGVSFVWPAGPLALTLSVRAGPAGPSSAGAELLRSDETGSAASSSTTISTTTTTSSRNTRLR